MTRTPADFYDRWLAELSPETIRQMFLDRGCAQVMVKRLAARQDNDKNQIYVGGDLAQLAWLPSGVVVASQPDSRKAGAVGKAKFTSSVNFNWFAPHGDSPAPEAKLIYYPQYPEVRLSGLLQGAPDGPRSLISRQARGQEAGRRLLLGTSVHSAEVWGMILPPESVAGATIDDLASDDEHGVFHLWQISELTPLGSTMDALLERLAEIHRMGFVPGRILRPWGPETYTASNAQGYTLEALCGVLPNGVGAPDYLGWELKAHSRGNSLTLFTPAPTAGWLKQVPRLDFMRLFGRHSPGGGIEPDRWDFTGLHKVGSPNASTGLKLAIDGWDHDRGVAPDGGIQLVAPGGREIARWSFEKMMNLWKLKHAQAAYVPYTKRGHGASVEFQFHDRVFLCEGTSFLHLLHGFAAATVAYDPGMNIKWVEGPQGYRWKSHDRHQFRSTFNNLGPLYDRAGWVALP